MTYAQAVRQMDNPVRTPNGIGVLLGKKTESNGLYYERERSEWHVWFGMDRPERKTGEHYPNWVSFTYHHRDLELLSEAEQRAWVDSLPERMRDVVCRLPDDVEVLGHAV